MKLLKPNWVSHDGGQAIFSIDIHPDGTRFSTGGQAEDGGGKVVIWNMAPVKDSRAESDPQVPKVLTELTNHLGCVNCTRWSRDGKYLASGSDDSIIIIWSLRYKTSGKPVFGLEKPVYEQWGCGHMLRGHNGDILDLAWSHDQRHLASCSVDNTIVIWNALKFPEKVNVIETHKGMVKGITWDPVGKYLASQSDDKTIRVWRTSDWSEETKISEPFRNCGGTTHMLRLSWSPDGRFIVSAHSLNNDGPTAHIIDRSTWKTGMDFVGHRKAIEVVKFNPHLFFMGNEGEGLEDERANHGCLAIGSRDRSLSIWLTSYKRPLVIVHELFNNSILDLSWSKDGYDLMACSLDGSVAFVSLTPQELGTSLNGYRLDELFMSLYGLKRLDHKEGFKSNHLIIEDPSMLSANPSLLDGRGGASTSRATPTKVPSASNQATPPNNKTSLVDDLPTIKKQTESRTPDGRRRIKPVMLASLPTIQSSSSSSFSLNDSPFTNSKIMATPPKTTPTKKPQKDEGIEAIKSPPARPITFAPLSPPTSKASSSKPSSSQSLSAAKALIGADKRPLEPDHTPDTQPATKTKRAKRAKTASHDDHVTKPRPVTKAAYQLEVPPLVPSLCLQLTTPMGGVSLEVTNDSVGVVKSGILTCKVDDACKWVCPLVSPALLIAANEHVTCTCTLDNAMLLVSTATGRLLTSRLLLSAPPYQSKVVSHYVAIATIDACVTVYDVLTMTAIVRRVAFGHVISGSSECVNIELTKTGVPVVVTTRGAHAYHSSMDGWVELSNPMDSSEIYSTSFSLSKPTGAVSSVLPLQSLQEMIHVDKANNLQSEGSTLVYLESQLFRSATLSSSLEYEQWVKSYVTYLVNKTHTERLREYCVALRTEGTEGIRPLTVLQCNRAKILNDILTIIATNPNMQRLYGELKEVFESEL